MFIGLLNILIQNANRFNFFKFFINIFNKTIDF